MLHDLASAALEQLHDLLYALVIFLLGNSAYAAAATFLYVIVQAGTVFASEYGVRGYLQIAGAELIGAVKEFHEIARMHYTAVRTEIARSVLDYTPREEDLREIACTDAYPRIGLGILQQDVVARLELLDQIVLQQKGVRLRLHHSVLRVCNLGDHHGSLARQPLGRHEILSHPLVQVLGLAHIYDIPLGVIITIDSGGMWKQRYFFFQGHFAETYSATASSMPAPWRPRLRMVPSGPMSIT